MTITPIIGPARIPPFQFALKRKYKICRLTSSGKKDEKKTFDSGVDCTKNPTRLLEKYCLARRKGALVQDFSTVLAGKWSLGRV